MLNNDSRRGIIGAALIFLLIFLGRGNDAGAQPGVKLVLDPEIRTIALNAPEAPKEVSIIARTSQQDLQYAWSLNGPGELLGEATGPGRLYAPPASLRETATAVITVTVTDAAGKQATATVTFTLAAPSPPTLPPILTPTPPPIPPRIQKIVLKDARGFFIHLPGDGKYRLKPGETVQIEVIVDNPSNQKYNVQCVSKKDAIQSETMYLAPDTPGERDTVVVKILTKTFTDTQAFEIKIVETAYR